MTSAFDQLVVDEEDRDRALALCSVLSPESADVRFFVIPGDPSSKSRPRFSRNGHAYTKAQDRAQERVSALHFKRVFKAPKTGNVAVGCIFFRSNRRWIDADNMLKHICDAANGIAYIDDSQVTAVLGVIELDRDNPRTIVMISDHETTMTRGKDVEIPRKRRAAAKPYSACAQCGKQLSHRRGGRCRECWKQEPRKRLDNVGEQRQA